ncbi:MULTISPECIES: cupin domain-containing protein [unclassified Alteromonas]|uniref:JmjC domain-containing protein n=1 Tax=unclassified Alteromonas TaxID=2614992 RepID=UPI001EF184AB|nr:MULTISPECIES: cupin domain-containing protein [unclassified Alteromonas]MCG7637607.1 cupin domain-containing protein [Alteromonas sp. CNT1-28]MCG7814590.1 cupin domain-containing protein [Alteromonas sp. MCA-1]
MPTNDNSYIIDAQSGNGFNAETFLKNYWQQKPVVIKHFFDNFVDPIDENDLAGLAQESEVDARIISNVKGSWHVEQGPITDFDKACQGKWTLLVQGVDKYVPDVTPLLDPFSFIPNWRLDDLMVSFATNGAGVGAHIDQYDVFLVQGKGRKRWRVGKPADYKEVFPHPKLRQIEGFDPVIDVVVEPGDVVYVPPGWPHDGATIEDSLTYSVGYRAPDNLQLAESLAMMLDKGAHNYRFTDASRSMQSNRAWVNPSDVAILKQQLIDAINGEDFTLALLEAMSEQGIPEYPLEDEVSLEQISNEFAAGISFVPAPGVRALLCDGKRGLPRALFVNGSQFEFGKSDQEWFEVLASGGVLNATCCQDAPSFTFLETLTTLINNGYWEWFEG